MFNFFKSGQSDRPKDVKSLRDAILRFIKEELKKMEGEGSNIKGLDIFVASLPEDMHLYEAALNTDNTDIFKTEIQRIADNYALELPANWSFEVNFVDALPTGSASMVDIPVSLFIRTKQQFIQQTTTAYIRILSGQAEREEYMITSSDPKITIGRERKAQVNDGFFRTNVIAFPGDCGNECNKYISRQHAHIKWDNDAGCFMLYADEGGVPPGNKIKIRAVDDENLVKLNSTQIGHALKEGDQVILGESAVIEFSTHPSA